MHVCVRALVCVLLVLCANVPAPLVLQSKATEKSNFQQTEEDYASTIKTGMYVWHIM